jgi:putative Holliday junction resolvase
MRFLGIDFGTRRWGLAFGDDLGVATPLPALVESEEAARFAGLRVVVRDRRITELVVGYPLNMDGTAGFKAKDSEAFAERLRLEFGLAVHLADERLTSYDAESITPKRKRRGLRAGGTIDSRSATIMLQDFLNEKLHLP